MCPTYTHFLMVHSDILTSLQTFISHSCIAFISWVIDNTTGSGDCKLHLKNRVWSIKNCKNIFHYCVNKKPTKNKFDKISELLTLIPFQNGTYLVCKSIFMDFRTNFVPKKIHQNSTFWPDLAPCLYSNENQEWLKENTLTFVPKLHNPPSVLQIRPIEVFWSILKQKVYSGDWSA